MLNIIMDVDNPLTKNFDRVIRYVCDYFDMYYKSEWTEDSFMHEVAKYTDKATFYCTNAFLNERGNGISPMVLSPVCKTLCCIYYIPEYVFYCNYVHNEHIKFLMRAAKLNDITIVLEHYLDFTDEDIAVGITVNGVQVRDKSHYLSLMHDWICFRQNNGYYDGYSLLTFRYAGQPLHVHMYNRLTFIIDREYDNGKSVFLRRVELCLNIRNIEVTNSLGLPFMFYHKYLYNQLKAATSRVIVLISEHDVYSDEFKDLVENSMHMFVIVLQSAYSDCIYGNRGMHILKKNNKWYTTRPTITNYYPDTQVYCHTSEDNDYRY